jgi:hypothetical protein
MSLRQTITTLADRFTNEVLAALRTASINEITALAAGGEAPARRRVSPMTSTRRTSARRSRLRRRARAKADVAKITSAIVEAVRKSGDTGMRVAAIWKALGLLKSEVQRPIAEALGQKLITKKGVKRATTYYAV